MAAHDGETETASPCRQGAHSQVKNEFSNQIGIAKSNTSIIERIIIKIIYAWARDAPKLELPDGVGFKVGKTSPIKYIILQVHYAHVHKFSGKIFLLFSFIFVLI